MTKKITRMIAMTKEATETPTEHRPPHQTAITTQKKKKKKVTVLNQRKLTRQQ